MVGSTGCKLPAVQRVHVRKCKYPNRAHMEGVLDEVSRDSYGSWLFRIPDAVRRHPGILLLSPDQWWVAWWWSGWRADADHPWIGVDVCTPAVRDDAGWRYNDLEIDLVGDRSGFVAVLDEDEFAAARQNVPYPDTIAAAALQSRDAVRSMLSARAEPFGSVGWNALNAARRQFGC